MKKKRYEEILLWAFATSYKSKVASGTGDWALEEKEFHNNSGEGMRNLSEETKNVGSVIKKKYDRKERLRDGVL